MRIREALKHHYNKHMVNYGIVSFVTVVIGAVFVPQVIKGIFKLVNNSYGWTIGLATGYLLILVAIALPFIFAVDWIISREGMNNDK